MGYTDLLTQTATYWATGANDGFGGLSYSAPVQILVRWEAKTALVQDGDGEEFLSYANVWTSTELAENGFLFLGTSAAADPQTVNDAYRIKFIEKSQTPAGDIIVHKNILGNSGA